MPRWCLCPNINGRMRTSLTHHLLLMLLALWQNPYVNHLGLLLKLLRLSFGKFYMNLYVQIGMLFLAVWIETYKFIYMNSCIYLIMWIDLCQFIYLHHIIRTVTCHYTYQFNLYKMVRMILYILLLHVLTQIFDITKLLYL